MSTDPAPAKPKCPECGVEITLVNGAMPEKCAKCEFEFEGWPAFRRWFRAAAKEFAAETEVQPNPATPPKSKASRFFPGRRK